jgi:hypothetical protein
LTARTKRSTHTTTSAVLQRGTDAGGSSLATRRRFSRHESFLEFNNDSFRGEVAFDKAVYPSLDGHECDDNDGYGDKVKVFR